MGGAIIADAALIDTLRKDLTSLGPTLDPHAAFLIQRGMRTYFLRYERECANALEVSRFLAAHPRVRRVYHPGLETHPQHLLAKRQMKDFGSIVSFELDGGIEAGNRFAKALRLFSITSSVGSTESLVMPPQLLGGQEYTRAQREASLIGPGTVRLSIGIEEAVDLIADLTQALSAAFV
jgi:cystathionine beta-lyase/cystathionine gamma-synthase